MSRVIIFLCPFRFKKEKERKILTFSQIITVINYYTAKYILRTFLLVLRERAQIAQRPCGAPIKAVVSR